MLNNGQSFILRSLLDYLNDNYTFEGSYKLKFDELSTSKDSICLTTSGDSTPVEKVSDVTGRYLSGTIRIAIVYRMMKASTGSQDLDAISIIDSLFSFIRSSYKLLMSDKFYITNVSQISGGKLDTAYATGVKDFRGIFELSYERQVF